MGWLTDVYMICAIVGGTLLVLQTILIVVGGGGDHDLGIGPDHDIGGGDHDGGHDGGDLTFIKWLSVKTVVAATSTVRPWRTSVTFPWPWREPGTRR